MIEIEKILVDDEIMKMRFDENKFVEYIRFKNYAMNFKTTYNFINLYSFLDDYFDPTLEYEIFEKIKDKIKENLKAIIEGSKIEQIGQVDIISKAIDFNIDMKDFLQKIDKYNLANLIGTLGFDKAVLTGMASIVSTINIIVSVYKALTLKETIDYYINEISNYIAITTAIKISREIKENLYKHYTALRESYKSRNKFIELLDKRIKFLSDYLRKLKAGNWLLVAVAVAGAGLLLLTKKK